MDMAPELQPGVPSSGTPGPGTTSVLPLCWGLVETVLAMEGLGWGPLVRRGPTWPLLIRRLLVLGRHPPPVVDSGVLQ